MEKDDMFNIFPYIFSDNIECRFNNSGFIEI